MDNALDVLQRYLDGMGKTLLDGDWDNYQAFVSLPYTLITEQTTDHITTLDGLQDRFDAFHQALKFQKVTQYVRLAETAQALSDTLMVGSFTTHVIAGSYRTVPPFLSTVTMRPDQLGTWRAVSATTAISNMHWPSHLPRADHLSKGIDND